jgi:hypothetical protein
MSWSGSVLLGGMTTRQPYPTALRDREWELIKPLVREAKPGGRPEQYAKRKILNGIFSLLRSLLLAVVVTAAGGQDRDGVKSLLEILRHQYSGWRHIWADQPYAGELMA